MCWCSVSVCQGGHLSPGDMKRKVSEKVAIEERWSLIRVIFSGVPLHQLKIILGSQDQLLFIRYVPLHQYPTIHFRRVQSPVGNANECHLVTK